MIRNYHKRVLVFTKVVRLDLTFAARLELNANRPLA
jgi:hypothetical protein